jgi:hypothetical protein
VAIGYGVALAGQVVVFPMFGIHASIGDNLGIGACFTAISLARSYALRRWFNRWAYRTTTTKPDHPRR